MIAIGTSLTLRWPCRSMPKAHLEEYYASYGGRHSPHAVGRAPRPGSPGTTECPRDLTAPLAATQELPVDIEPVFSFRTKYGNRRHAVEAFGSRRRHQFRRHFYQGIFRHHSVTALVALAADFQRHVEVYRDPCREGPTQRETGLVIGRLTAMRECYPSRSFAMCLIFSLA